MNNLPLIIGYGGINAGGISSSDQSYRNMVAPSLSVKQREKLNHSLANLISASGIDAINKDPAYLADKFFIRRITQPDLFDPKTTDYYRTNGRTEKFPISFAASLPDGFNPGAFYDSNNHPRGLQMAVFAANDALNSAGLDEASIREAISPDRVAVYAGSGLGQLDNAGMGGVLTSMLKRKRTVTKQLPFSYPQMSADFVNAYVLNNLGVTGHYCGACATFLYNMELAAKNIKNDSIDLALVGASEAPILPQLISAFYNMRAMTSDAKLGEVGDFSHASIPFGENCGFVMGESAQFIVMASPECAYKLEVSGSNIRGAVADVFINADGPKRSISSPGPGNYITLAKAVASAIRLFGSKKVANTSYVHAHGTSTPQNRVTESQILSRIATHFKINDWPVMAVKSYLGHSQAAAAADQTMAALGYWNYGILPGISTIDRLADDVATANLQFNLKHQNIGVEAKDISFINTKGFGGNNATATLLSPKLANEFYKKQIGSRKLNKISKQADSLQEKISSYMQDTENGKFHVTYELASSVASDQDIKFEGDYILIKDYPPIKL